MNEAKLNRETELKLDKLVERVARKAGYAGQGDLTYKEHLQIKLQQQREKLARKMKKYRHKFSLKSAKTDFAEEIRTYLKDGLKDLMDEGYDEETALLITTEKFDEAELKENFDDFLKAFDGFGMEEYTMRWYRDNGESIGLFYAAFLLLGLTIGTFIGYLGGHTLLSSGIGLGVGVGVGIGLGLLSNAVIVLVKRK